MVGGHFVAEVHQMGGGLEAQDDALQAGHVGVPGAEIGAPGDEGGGGRRVRRRPGSRWRMAAGRNYSVCQTFLPIDGS
jgi:hypothetical protein